jgi:hypothetical protein
MNVKDKAKQLNLVYWAMALMQVIVGVVLYVLIKNGMLLPDYTLAILLQKIAMFLVPGLMAAGYFLFKYLLARVDMNQRLEVKFQRYFSLIMLRAALFEIAFFFCCIAAAITGVELFHYMAPIAFLLFLLMRPNPADMKSDLQLSESDSIKLFGS